MKSLFKLLTTILLLAPGSAAIQESLFFKIPTRTPTQSPSIRGATSSSPPFTTLAPTRSPSIPQSPTATERFDPEQCNHNNDLWKYAISTIVDGSWQVLVIGCDDSRVACDYEGDIGFAKDHCCKCRVECAGQCNNPVYTPETPQGTHLIEDHDSKNDDDSNFPSAYPFIAFGLVALCCCSLAIWEPSHKRDLRASRQAMTQRRQQERESNNGQILLSEEQRKHARYELFVTKFHFQRVSPETSTNCADSFRFLTPTKKEEPPKDEEETTENGVENHISFPDSISSLRMPGPKDECCICLESYREGETICTPITPKCTHRFHEFCAYEWLKTRDQCPLCRMELLKD